MLVRDRDGALSRLRKETGPALRVTLVDKADGSKSAVGVSWQGESIRLTDQSSGEEVAAAIDRIAKAKQVILSLFVKVRELSGGIGLPSNLDPVMQSLRADQDVTVVSFGSPYVIRNLPIADAFVAAFATTKRVHEAVSNALKVGGFRGRLPVAIPGVAPAGFGLSDLGAGHDDGLDNPELPTGPLPDALQARLQLAIDDGAMPGAVCYVSRRGQLAARVVAGHESYASGSPLVTVAQSRVLHRFTAFQGPLASSARWLSLPHGRAVRASARRGVRAAPQDTRHACSRLRVLWWRARASRIRGPSRRRSGWTTPSRPPSRSSSTSACSQRHLSSVVFSSTDRRRKDRK